MKGKTRAAAASSAVMIYGAERSAPALPCVPLPFDLPPAPPPPGNISSDFWSKLMGRPVSLNAHPGEEQVHLHVEASHHKKLQVDGTLQPEGVEAGLFSVGNVGHP